MKFEMNIRDDDNNLIIFKCFSYAVPEGEFQLSDKFIEKIKQAEIEFHSQIAYIIREFKPRRF